MTDEPFRTSRRAVQLARLAQAICLLGVASRLLFVYSVGSNRVAMGRYIRGLEPNLPALISDETRIVLAWFSPWTCLCLRGYF